MSWRDDDSRSEPDDWFQEPEEEWVDPLARAEGPYEEEPRLLPETTRRLVVAGLAALVAIVLVGWGIARVVGGDDEEAATTPAPTATDPAVPTAPETTAETTTEPGTPITVPENVTLRLGDEGAEVEELQRALTQLGYEPGPVDGAFGGATAEALRAFQTDAELSADGVAGPQTLAALNAALAEAPG